MIIPSAADARTILPRGGQAYVAGPESIREIPVDMKADGEEMEIFADVASGGVLVRKAGTTAILV